MTFYEKVTQLCLLINASGRRFVNAGILLRRFRDDNQVLFKLYVNRMLYLQTAHGLWNKGLLYNACVLEMERRYPGYYQCVVLHDIDLLPETDRMVYNCTTIPRQLGAYLQHLKYK